MPRGTGTYGKKRGRPRKNKKKYKLFKKEVLRVAKETE